MRRTAIFRDDLFKEHDPGFDHIESPERITTLFTELESLSHKNCFIEPPFSPASEKTLLLNHTSEHIERVKATSGKIYSALDDDTFTSAKSYEAATLAAGAMVEGIDLVAAGKIDNGFALVRPPGHHAERHKSMGYCLFNNIALAARHAIENLGIKRIVVIDWDVHHGNGTQNAFYDSDKVLFISVHQSPLYPGTGDLTEFGTGEGEGYNLNVPLPGGQGDIEYANIFNNLIQKAVYQYQPEMILVSAGFDAYHAEPMSAMRLTHQGFAYMTRSILKWADDLCAGKVLVTLEGGYDLTGLKESVFATLSELLGEKLTTPSVSAVDESFLKSLENEQTPHPAIERVREQAKAYWKM